MRKTVQCLVLSIVQRILSKPSLTVILSKFVLAIQATMFCVYWKLPQRSVDLALIVVYVKLFAAAFDTCFPLNQATNSSPVTVSSDAPTFHLKL